MTQDPILVLNEKIEMVRDSLKAFLIKCGVAPSGNQLKDLLNDLSKVRYIVDGRTYVAASLNELGYINSVVETSAIMENIVLPEDIFRGYYKVENGQLVLDENRKKVLWED